MNPRDFIAVELLVLLPLLWVLYHTVRPWPLSPVWVLLFGYIGMGVAGRFALRYCNGMLQAMYNMPITQREDTLAYFLYVCIAFGVGAALWVFLIQPSLPHVQSPQQSEYPEPGVLWIAGSLVPLIVYIVGCGPAILDRAVYLTEVNALQILGRSTASAGAAFAGALCVSSRSRLKSAFAILAAAGYFLITFAMATRLMALIPLFFALGAFASRPDLKVARWMPAVGFLLALPLIPIPLYLRGLPEQGLIPFFHILGRVVQSLQGNGVASAILGNILFPFPLTEHVGAAHKLPFAYLWTDVNPLPGRLTDWYQIQPYVMANFFTPYNALGELLNFGYAVAGVFYFIVGLYFAHLESSIRQAARRGQFLLALMLFGFPAVFVLLTVEYPLRASCRVIYYGIVLESVIWFLLGSDRREEVLMLRHRSADTAATS